MQAYETRPEIFRSYRSTGTTLGAIVGSMIGAVVAFTLLTVVGAGLVVALVALALFSAIFAAYGNFMGWLFDVDAQERGSTAFGAGKQTIKSNSNRIKTQPLPILR